MVEPDYDFFATRPPVPAPGADVAPVRFAAMPSPGPAPMSAWNPDPVLASSPPFAASPSRAFGAPPAAPSGSAVPRQDAPPRNVVAVAVLALVIGILGLVAAAFGAVAASQLGSEVGRLGAAGADELGSSLVMAAMLGVAVIAAGSAYLLVAGAATIRHRRWGAWMLVVAFGLHALNGVRYLVTEGVGLASVLGMLIAVVLLAVLVTGEGKRWLVAG